MVQFRSVVVPIDRQTMSIFVTCSLSLLLAVSLILSDPLPPVIELDPLDTCTESHTMHAILDGLVCFAW